MWRQETHSGPVRWLRRRDGVFLNISSAISVGVYPRGDSDGYSVRADYVDAVRHLFTGDKEECEKVLAQIMATDQGEKA